MSCCSCSCGNNCQPGCGCYIVNLPDNPVTEYNFSNDNLNGIGVLDGVSGSNVGFRGIVAGNASILVTLDAGNNSIVISLDPDALIVDIPQATTTQRGIGETATNAEAQSKASTTVFLTPSNLSALGASDSFAGLVELATDAETQAGVSTTLAVTPAGLASVIDTLESPAIFADAVARAAAAPGFIGQFGATQDTRTAWLGDGLGAGDWTGILTAGATNNFNGVGITTELYFQGAEFHFEGGGSGILYFNDGFYGVGPGAVFSFDGASTFAIGGAEVPALHTVTTGIVGGQLTSKAISEYLSTANVQTGWAVSNPSVSRTLDVAAATLGDVRAVLGTLINDLKAVLLPAT